MRYIHLHFVHSNVWIEMTVNKNIAVELHWVFEYVKRFLRYFKYGFLVLFILVNCQFQVFGTFYSSEIEYLFKY